MLISLKRNILGLITRIDVKTGFIVNSLVRPRNVTPVFGTVSSDSWQARRYINNLVFGTVSTDSWQPRRYINNRARQAGRVRTHLNTAPWCTRAQCADMCAYVTGCWCSLCVCAVLVRRTVSLWFAARPRAVSLWLGARLGS